MNTLTITLLIIGWLAFGFAVFYIMTKDSIESCGISLVDCLYCVILCITGLVGFIIMGLIVIDFNRIREWMNNTYIIKPKKKL